MGVAVSFAMPTKFYDNTTFNKILIRSLRIFCLGLFLYFFGQIEIFGLQGISLLLSRLVITTLVGYALMGNFSAKIKAYLVFAVLGIMLFLAYSGIEAYQNVRIPGVLQRIAIIYFVVSLLYLKTNQKTQLLIAAALLLGYWALMTLVPIPGIGAPNLDKGTNLAAWVDSILLKGHMWNGTKTWDPEGILSTIPVVASGIIGLLIGQLLNSPLPKLEIAKKMVLIGIPLVALGQLWDIIFPINKSLWTSSYVLYTSGLATISLAILYYIIDIAKYTKWAKLFLIFGVNSMIVFFLSGIIPRGLKIIEFQNPKTTSEKINLLDYLYSFGIEPYFNNPMNASLSFALLYVLFWAFLLWVFYKNKLIFKV
jgi:predicted acyltransferase